MILTNNRNKFGTPSHILTRIIFDVGGVIINADRMITYKQLEMHGVSKKKSRTFFDNEEYKEFSRGKISHITYYKALTQKYLGIHLPYQTVVAAHDAHIFGINEKVVAILSTFPNRKLAIMTDTNEWQTRREKELIDLSQYSETIVRSYEIHLLKLDEGCFSTVMSLLGVDAQNALLIDDSIEKVRAAQENGLQVHLFKNAQQLTTYLHKRELI